MLWRAEGELCRTENSPRARGEGVSVAAPQAWNRLPTDLKTLRSTPALKRSLNTFLFRTAYNVDFSAFTYRLYSQTVPVISFFSVPDIAMRRRSIWMRRTKSIVVFVFVFEWWICIVTHAGNFVNFSLNRLASQLSTYHDSTYTYSASLAVSSNSNPYSCTSYAAILNNIQHWWYVDVGGPTNVMLYPYCHIPFLKLNQMFKN